MCNCNNNTNCQNDDRANVRHALRDTQDINEACQKILRELGNNCNNNSCGTVRDIRRELIRIDEDTCCIENDVKDINSNGNREQLRIIDEMTCDIYKQTRAINEILNNSCGNASRDARAIRERVFDIEEDCCEMEKALRALRFEECRCEVRECRDCIDVNVRISRDSF